jgi:hypothetical protein
MLMCRSIINCMNYDLCDLLNRKMENSFGYMSTDMPKNSILKTANIIDDFFEYLAPEEYLETMESEDCDHECFGFWIYRNGKISNQIEDFDKSARKITRELANLSFSNSPALDIMYFSGCIKMLISKNKALYLETCIRPTLDQMFAIKDLEGKFLSKSGKVLWRVVERKKKSTYYDGVGSNSLHDFRWGKIK